MDREVRAMKRNYRIQSLPRMFEQVARQIVDFIQSEKVEPGTKLPTERQLSELLQVSRSSVREGIRVLELLRYLESRQGEGTFVTTPPPFLLPSRVIGEKLSPSECDHYFEIALMCAEKILWLSLQANLSPSQTWKGGTFWENFHALLLDLSKKLKNPYYSFLWSDTFQLLSEMGYFADKTAPFELGDFLAAFHAHDVEKLKKFLNLLSDSL
jgi:GntR family transcriptional repressor for pyruvate dehydrogenase complex